MFSFYNFDMDIFHYIHFLLCLMVAGGEAGGMGTWPGLGEMW